MTYIQIKIIDFCHIFPPQVWFRAVPGMHQSLLKEVAAQLNQQPHSGGMVNSAAFCQACDASGLPLSHAECFMLGQLLTRRKPNTAGESSLLF